MKYLSKFAQGLTPYVAGEQPQDKRYIKLNTNENPYPPSPKVNEAVVAFDFERLKKYPDPEARILTEALAELYGVERACVFVGNGSDEVLSMCFRAFFDEGDEVAVNDISYSFYPVFCDYYNLKPQIIKLDSDYTVPLAAYKDIKAKGIVIANPNAPTSIAITREEVLQIVKDNRDKVVLVDEAYAAFCKESVINDVSDNPNLVVTRTASKSNSLAGIRCGVAVASPEIISGLKAVRDGVNSYTVDTLAQVICAASCKDKAYTAEVDAKIVATRDKAIKKLRELGYTMPNSSSNFIFLEVGDGEKIYKALKERGILVRFFKSLPSKLRVTVGTEEETAAFITALEEIKRDSI